MARIGRQGARRRKTGYDEKRGRKEQGRGGDGLDEKARAGRSAAARAPRHAG